MKPLLDILESLEDDSWRVAYTEFHKNHLEDMKMYPASKNRHHCWVGGYLDHVTEVVNNIIILLNNIPVFTSRTFTRDDAIAAAYIHDLDKLFERYDIDPEPPTYGQTRAAEDLGIKPSENDNKTSISWKIDTCKKTGEDPDERAAPFFKYRQSHLYYEDSGIVAFLCSEHGLPLNREILSAVSFHHGGWSPYARYNKGDLSALSTLLHSADILSVNCQNVPGTSESL